MAVLATSADCASYEGARLYVSGTEALDRGETAAAIAQLERAAQLVPDASEIENHLGLAYVRAGRTNDARAAFRRALALDCDNEAARANLAMAERTQEDRRIPEQPRTSNDER
jgi:Flp pilus assembly protein TadD